MSTTPTSAPLLIGLRAARANILPGLIVQSIMITLVLLYYFAPATRSAFDAVARLKLDTGLWFSILSAILAGAVAPELLKIICFQHGRPNYQNLRTLLATALLWGFQGFYIDYLYRFQSFLFGRAPTIPTIAAKVAFDQFVSNPLFTSIFNAITYHLLATTFTAPNVRRTLSFTFYRTHVFPILIATWGVWIPIVSAIYALPPALQIPLFSLALTFWATMLAWIGNHNRTSPTSATAVAKVTSA